MSVYDVYGVYYHLVIRKKRKGEDIMNRTDKLEYEYIKAIKTNPCNSSLYNDYGVFLEKYRNDDYSAIKYFNRAIRLAPNKQIYKSNLNKILKKLEAKSRRRHMIFVIFLACLMFWLGYNGYSNFANIVPLFLLAQIILNSQRNYTKNLINEEVSHI